MLELRPVCENCNKQLLPDAADAMICSYECTFCAGCVTNVLHNVCPNCGGGFVPRPVRPKEKLVKDPAVEIAKFKPVDMEQFSVLLTRYQDVPAGGR